jgi:hypothetical protein
LWGKILLEHCADEDIRNNIFTANDTCMEGRITDKAVDNSVTQLILLPVLYISEAQLASFSQTATSFYRPSNLQVISRLSPWCK